MLYYWTILPSIRDDVIVASSYRKHNNIAIASLGHKIMVNGAMCQFKNSSWTAYQESGRCRAVFIGHMALIIISYVQLYVIRIILNYLHLLMYSWIYLFVHRFIYLFSYRSCFSSPSIWNRVHGDDEILPAWPLKIELFVCESTPLNIWINENMCATHHHIISFIFGGAVEYTAYW